MSQCYESHRSMWHQHHLRPTNVSRAWNRRITVAIVNGIPRQTLSYLRFPSRNRPDSVLLEGSPPNSIFLIYLNAGDIVIQSRVPRLGREMRMTWPPIGCRTVFDFAAFRIWKHLKRVKKKTFLLRTILCFVGNWEFTLKSCYRQVVVD